MCVLEIGTKLFLRHLRGAPLECCASVIRSKVILYVVVYNAGAFDVNGIRIVDARVCECTVCVYLYVTVFNE